MNTLLININDIVNYFLNNIYLVSIATIILFVLFLKESFRSILKGKFNYAVFIYLSGFILYLIMMFDLLRKILG